jgi:hypothetical protein
VKPIVIPLGGRKIGKALILELGPRAYRALKEQNKVAAK